MNVYLIFYTNAKFRTREQELINFYRERFSNIIPYRSEDVKTGNFFKENQSILNCETGDGFWLWKPKIILDTFEKINYGDIVVYIDAGDILHFNEQNVKEYGLNNDYYFTNWNNTRKPQKTCTKKDCFVLMNCDTSVYHDVSQVEAGILIFKKTQFNINLVNEYYKYCCIKSIVDNEENIYGSNLPGWICHRNDQSILTNLIVKHNLKFNSTFDNYISYNVYIPK